MAGKEQIPKFDPNTEAFQMRAQWKKSEVCRQMWKDRWLWLLDERKRALQECNDIRREAAAVLPRVGPKVGIEKSLKPVPQTSTGIIGWVASKPDCKLEIYSSWLSKPPIRLPDAWELKDYDGTGTNK